MFRQIATPRIADSALCAQRSVRVSPQPVRYIGATRVGTKGTRPSRDRLLADPSGDRLRPRAACCGRQAAAAQSVRCGLRGGSALPTREIWLGWACAHIARI